MNSNIEQDLKRTMELISATWEMQCNKKDKTTNFIYKMRSLDECLVEIERRGADKDYALHRWYNFMTSCRCEYIFCDFGAVHEKNVYNHNIDIYIDNVPFDVKLTVYPGKLLDDRPYDLSTRSGKDDMIRWYYANQSPEDRKQMLNRIYVVCDTPSSQANMEMKCNFDLMRERISAYMDEYRKTGFNEITITDDGKNYLLKSDIVRLN